MFNIFILVSGIWYLVMFSAHSAFGGLFISHRVLATEIFVLVYCKS